MPGRPGERGGPGLGAERSRWLMRPPARRRVSELGAQAERERNVLRVDAPVDASQVGDRGADRRTRRGPGAQPARRAAGRRAVAWPASVERRQPVERRAAELGVGTRTPALGRPVHGRRRPVPRRPLLVSPRPPPSSCATSGRRRRPGGRTGRAAGPTAGGGSGPGRRRSTGSCPAARRRRTGTGSWRPRGGTAPVARRVAAARATRTTPSSSGWRSASRTSARNSPSSSRKSTPRVRERDLARAHGALPPPTSDTARRAVVRRPERRPAHEPAGGEAEARRRVDPGGLEGGVGVERRGAGPAAAGRASSCPRPAGPTSSRWWPPAAATSSAKRANGWPRTSARSGAGGQRRDRAGGGGSGHGARPGSDVDQLGDGVRHGAPRGGRPARPRGSRRWATTTAGQSSASTSETIPGTGADRAVEPELADEPDALDRRSGESPVATRSADGDGRSRPEPDLAHAPTAPG